MVIVGSMFLMPHKSFNFSLKLFLTSGVSKTIEKFLEKKLEIENMNFLGGKGISIDNQSGFHCFPRNKRFKESKGSSSPLLVDPTSIIID